MAGKELKKVENNNVKQDSAQKVDLNDPLKQAAEISSMCRAAGMNITVPNMAIIIRLIALHKSKGTGASFDDIQNIITSVYHDPRFQPQQPQGQ